MTLSTHVLDANTGRPACKLPVSLDRRSGDGWVRLGNGMTDDDGRCQSMAPDGLPGRGLPAFVQHRSLLLDDRPAQLLPGGGDRVRGDRTGPPPPRTPSAVAIRLLNLSR